MGVARPPFALIAARFAPLAAISLGLHHMASSRFLTVGGSDAAATIYAPAVPSSVAVAFMLAAALLFALLPRRRAVALVAWAVLTLLLTHRVVADGARGTVADVWLMIDVRTMVVPAEASATIANCGPLGLLGCARAGDARLTTLAVFPLAPTDA